jgi:hypothetical protein
MRACGYDRDTVGSPLAFVMDPTMHLACDSDEVKVGLGEVWETGMKK